MCWSVSRIMLYAVGESKLANVGCPNWLRFPQILANVKEVGYALRVIVV